MLSNIIQHCLVGRVGGTNRVAPCEPSDRNTDQVAKLAWVLRRRYRPVPAISASGSKSWIFRFSNGGKRREMGLGPLHTISLAMAGEKA